MTTTNALSSLIGKTVILELRDNHIVRGVLTANDTTVLAIGDLIDAGPRTITLDGSLIVNWANVVTVQAGR